MEIGKKDDFKRSDDFVSLYVNSTQFGFTRWDFQIMFGRVEVSRDPTESYSKEVAVVTMTPEYAKALLVDFTKVISEFEGQYGTIVAKANIPEISEQEQ